MVQNNPTDTSKMTKRELQSALAAAERRCEGKGELILKLERWVWELWDESLTQENADAIEFWLKDKHCPSCQKRGGHT